MLSKDDFRRRLAWRVRNLRAATEWTLEEAAEFSYLTPQTLCLIENGKTLPTVATIYKIATAFNLSLSQFFEGVDDERQ